MVLFVENTISFPVELKFVKNQFTINVLVYFLTLNPILLIYMFIFISKYHSAVITIALK